MSELLIILGSLCGLGALVAFASTVGAASLAVTSPQDYTSGGGVNRKAVATAATVVSASGGRLMKVLVTAVTTGTTWTLYDANNTTIPTGAVVVGVIPSGATAGQIYDLRMPVQFGITAVPTGGTAGGLTVSFN